MKFIRRLFNIFTTFFGDSYCHDKYLEILKKIFGISSIQVDQDQLLSVSLQHFYFIYNS